MPCDHFDVLILMHGIGLQCGSLKESFAYRPLAFHLPDKVAIVLRECNYQ